MTCFNQRLCYFPPGRGRPHFLRDFIGAPDQQLWKSGFVPCRRCAGCLEADSGSWAIRCVHESKMHKRNCFLTLTLDTEHLLENRFSVRRSDISGFMKALRRKHGAGIRFFGCGEYGARTGRAHYHVILFGFDFDDRVVCGRSSSGHPMFKSEELTSLWGKGLCTVQDLTPETAGYAARYSSKKMDAQLLESERRRRLLPDGVTWVQLNPEFLHMSRVPGIAETWFRKYWRDVYKVEKGVLVSAVVFPGGGTRVPPAYYDRLFREMSESAYQRMKDVRRAKAQELASLQDATPARLAVREIVADAKIRNTRSGRGG